ncbi:MAG TPA: tetratricopeptide repeat protein, partial [Verrucomicrobiae bacterium]|nr:tetratricopeptide repeat protein [Verrucomicrobiae bacterium]
MASDEKWGEANLRRRDFSRLLIVALLLAAATVIVYWPAREGGFVGYDDPGYYSQNAHVLGGFTTANIRWAFTNFETANWHPVTWLSLMFDADLFGNTPAGPHLTNVLLHTANVVLLLILLFQLTRRRWPAAVVAALFAVHPLHVESVAWVAERKDVLSTFFGLLALIGYGRYATATGKSRRGFYAAALALFACGLMAKPLVVTLPFVMLLLDYWPLGRLTIHDLRSTGVRLIVEKIPFFLLSAADCVVTVIAQKRGEAIVSTAQVSIPMRIENAVVSYARYLEKLFWPVSLATPYPHPQWWPAATVAVAVVLLLLASVAAVAFARKFRFGLTGWLWFLGTFVPMIGLVQVGGAAMADRYSYLPSIGIFLIVVWGGTLAVEKFPGARVPALILALAVLVGLSWRTREQIRFWKNDGTLFGHALAVTKDNYVASINYGVWLSKNGQPAEALHYYYDALKLATNDPTALYDIGNAFEKAGNWDEAIREYRLALQLSPSSPDILDNLGLALAQEQQWAAAVTNFEA